MKSIRSILLLALMAMMVNNANAQTPQNISFDTVSNLLQIAPYTLYNLTIPKSVVDKSGVINVFIHGVTRSKDDTKAAEEPVEKSPNAINASFDTSRLLIVRLEPMLPKSQFNIIIRKMLSPEKMRKVSHLNIAILDKAKYGADSTQELFKDLLDALSTSTPKDKRQSSFFLFGDETGRDEYVARFNKNVTLTEQYTKLAATPLKLDRSITSAQLDALKIILKDNHLVIKSVSGLSYLTNIPYTDLIANGIMPLPGFKVAKPVSEYDFESRINNLKSTGNALDTIMANLSDYVYLNSGISTYIDIVNDLKKQCGVNQKQIQGGYKGILKALNNDDQIRDISVLGVSSNDEFDVTTTQAAYLTLDAGIVSLLARNNNGNISAIPRPFIGVEINFMQINKNFPLRKLHSRKETKKTDNGNDLLAYRSLWNHMSVTAGLSLGAMTNPDFTSLIGSMNGMLGLSYRFYHVFRFGSGMSLLQRIDPNPIITKPHFLAGGYVSLSIDLAFVNTVSQFTSALLK